MNFQGCITVCLSRFCAAFSEVCSVKQLIQYITASITCQELFSFFSKTSNQRCKFLFARLSLFFAATEVIILLSNPFVNIFFEEFEKTGNTNKKRTRHSVGCA